MALTSAFSWTSFIGHVGKSTLVSCFMWTMSASKRAELCAGCALWWGGSLVSSFICNHLKPGEINPVPGMGMTTVHFCSAPILALVKERKLPFSAALRYHSLIVLMLHGQPRSEKVLFSLLETSQSSVAPTKLKHRFDYLTNYFLISRALFILWKWL